MEIEKIKLNKTKSILQFGIPATIGMLMTSLITIVDGYFAGNAFVKGDRNFIFGDVKILDSLAVLPVVIRIFRVRCGKKSSAFDKNEVVASSNFILSKGIFSQKE